MDEKDFNYVKNSRHGQGILVSIKDSDLGSNFIQLTLQDTNSFRNGNKRVERATIIRPIDVKLNLKRSPGVMESFNVYRFNSDMSLMTKIDHQKVHDSIVQFQTSERNGVYIVKYERDFTPLIVSLVLICVLVVVGASIGIYLWRNPKYLHRIRYTTNRFKRSMGGEI